MSWISELLVPFIALSAMEIILGIDNIVFIAILTDRLPSSQQGLARRLGLAAAMLMRIALLLSLKWVLGLTAPLFELHRLGLPESLLPEEVNAISLRDLILLAGGLFLIGKSVYEIHHQVEARHAARSVPAKVSFSTVLLQIALIDVIFSLDSVITAVGMVRNIGVMIAAVIAAIVVMMIFADAVSAFIKRHPTVKMLALSFLILIGVLLVAEGVGAHFDKGYVYFAMAFSLGVELLNIRASRQPAAMGKT